ncbi:MAG: M20/M25/M40 family metallo-hydrolase, partial [Candidatus Thorarchaeota archaeon]
MSSENLDQKVLNKITEKDIVKLASDLIRFPSFPGEESDVAQYLADYMEAKGFKIVNQEVEPGRYQPFAILESGENGASMLFNGHMDIDPIPRGEHDPFEPKVKDGYLFGAGLYNMKSGVTSMVIAAVA